MNIVKELHILLEEFKFEPRRIQSREEEKTKKLELLLQQTHIKGDLNLTNTNITSLGNLEYVGGNLYLNSCTNLTSLGNLKYVGGTLDLQYCINLTSLDNLKSVGRYLDLGGTNITYIDPSIIIKSIIIKGSIYKGQNVFKSIESFNKFYQKENLKEEFKFQPRKIEDRKEKQEEIEKKKLEGFFSCIGTVDELFEFFKKKTDRLDSRTKETCSRLSEDPRTKTKDGLIFIRKLSNKIKVANDNNDAIILKIQYTGSLILGSISSGLQFKDHILSKEGGFIDKETFYKVIGRLLDLLVKEILENYKGEKLKEGFKFEPRRLEGREEEKTKKLELLLQQTHIEDDLDLSNTNVTSLGNLEYVGGSFYLLNTKITSLGNLKFVRGDLDLSNTKITSLGNLESVGGWIDLYNCKNLTSLGNLKYVGGYLDLDNTKITYIDPSIIIKGSIYTDKKAFKTIEKFNKYYQDKQDLKEEFKFEPRRIKAREDDNNAVEGVLNKYTLGEIKKLIDESCKLNYKIGECYMNIQNTNSISVKESWVKLLNKYNERIEKNESIFNSLGILYGDQLAQVNNVDDIVINKAIKYFKNQIT